MKWFITECYYLLSLLALLHELMVILSPKKQFAYYAEVRALKNDKDALAKHFDQNKATHILHIGYLAWVMLGLLTPYFIYFGVILLLSLSCGQLRKAHWSFVLADGIISALLLIMIILERYHNITIIHL